MEQSKSHYKRELEMMNILGGHVIHLILILIEFIYYYFLLFYSLYFFPFIFSGAIKGDEEISVKDIEGAKYLDDSLLSKIKVNKQTNKHKQKH